MKRRDFLTHTAGIASILATGSSRSEVTPCPPPLDGVATNCPDDNPPPEGGTVLERRTSALTSANTPVANVNYFRSEEGSPQIPNNRTNQLTTITYSCEGIYYDPNRRLIHQLDREHTGGFLEHAIYDEVANTPWVQVDTSGQDPPADHWRECAFVPETGDIYHRKEGDNLLWIYDAANGTWGTTASTNLTSGDGGVHTIGYHANLFGAGRPGILHGAQLRFHGYEIATDEWTYLGSATNSNTGLTSVPYRGHSAYLAGRDELLFFTSSGDCFAIAAGAGLLSQLSTANVLEQRNAPQTPIQPTSSNPKAFSCMHPRQPDTILAMDGAMSGGNVGKCYYTKDGGTTPWVTASFTHPFMSEFGIVYMTVGSLPNHGVVAGAQGSTDNTKFVFWKPPLV